MACSKPLKPYQKAVYKCPNWKGIREQVIARDRGICYFCGKLVTRRQTIHHLQEINENNFSDINIAFNLDNLVLCHAQCHDEHHHRFGYKNSIVNDDLSINYEKRTKCN